VAESQASAASSGEPDAKQEGQEQQEQEAVMESQTGPQFAH
jgi:hypothetical protein